MRLGPSLIVTAIVFVQEQIEDCDSCAGHIRRTYDVSYIFGTASGQSIEGFVNVGYDPTESGEETVAIVYNPSNPSESRLAKARQSTITGAVVIGLILTSVAVVLCLFGVSVIRDGLAGFDKGRRLPEPFLSRWPSDRSEGILLDSAARRYGDSFSR